MSLLGLHLTVLVGPTVPLPVPPPLLQALDGVEVSTSDEGRSGFQLVFKATRTRAMPFDFPVLQSPQLRAGHRVILVATLGTMPTVLMDGIITNRQLQPATPGSPATLTLTGEDLASVMDREERSAEHPAQPDHVIALGIIARYAVHGMLPVVVPPPSLDVPLPIERTPVQQATDLAYLGQLAARHAYVFHVTPGPLPGTNTAYWGPPVRVGVPQRALSVDMGPYTNVESITVQHEATQAVTLQGTVQDRRTNAQLPVLTFLSTRPPLALDSPLLDPLLRRVERFRAESGQDAGQALAQAQARTDASMDTVTIEGELDTARYGGPLRARALVGLRGVGLSYDGLYYVKKVAHSLAPGRWTQKFTLVREGTGSTVPVVIP